jgi:glycerophosphocholine phosphodiesterase GPCPD1
MISSLPLPDRTWSAEVGIPSDVEVEYRYFVASIDPQIGNDMVHVRRWETHLTPRRIQRNSEAQNSVETFGVVDGVEKVDRGWLTNETVVQFKFFNNPFNLKERVKNRMVFVKVIDHQISEFQRNGSILFS